MRCPRCKADNDKVVDSRASEGGESIRRRRVCVECDRRYTTYERIEESPLLVIKKNGRRASLDRHNILAGMTMACRKRGIEDPQLEAITDEIVAELRDRFDKEVPSEEIGNAVMSRLKGLDKVAYVRFASVYREFEDVNDFVDEAKLLDQNQGGERGVS